MHVVTGGAGFIGSAVVSKLNAEGINDILIVDELGHSEKWKNLLNSSYLEYFHKDDFIKLLEAGKFKGQISAVVHMGACSSTTETDMDFLMQNNFGYSMRLAKHCLESGIRFIYASSAATYGDGAQGYSDRPDDFSRLRPLNRYGYSKHLFDLWTIRNKVWDQICGLKFFNVYGPNEYHKEDMRSVVNKAYHQIKESGRVRLFKSYRPEFADGEQKRDFIYVKDCADVIWWLLNNSEVNGVFNLGTGNAESWNALASAVFSALGLQSNIEYIDMPEALRSQYQYFTQAEMLSLKQAGCPVHFRSLAEGVRDYVQNYLEQTSSCL